jgi:carbamoyl-phosphate synthase large subunit
MVPIAESPTYFEVLERLVRRHDIGAIVPMSEAEIARFAAEGFLESFLGCDVIAANRSAIEIGLDKYETYRMLVRAGLPAPWTCVVGEEYPKSFPCILKPRRGQGSKGLMRVEAGDAAALAPIRHGDIWQELILPDEPEYTCGLYRTNDGDIRTLILDRKLQGGTTKSAVLVEDQAIDSLLRRIAEALELRGAINVQLRVDEEGPKVFEINPRFSSTVGFRHRLGYSDFIWSLRERQGLPPGDYRPGKVGTRIFRGTSLLVIEP